MAKSIKKRTASHIYFGVVKNTGELVHISDVPSGKKCGCICIACQKPLEARKGEIRRHHFAHISNYECMYASEVAVYKALADIIETEGTISLPAVSLKFDSYRKDELIQNDRTLPVCSTSFECEPLVYPPTLKIAAGGSHLRVLIDFNNYYTPEDLETLIEEAEKDEHSVLLYKMPKIETDNYFTPANLRDVLRTHKGAEWLFSRLAARWRKRYFANARTPAEFQSGFLCPISRNKFNGTYAARRTDCARCEYNIGTPPGCKCLAFVGIRCKEDFTRPLADRMADIESLRLENEARIAEDEKRKQSLRPFIHATNHTSSGPTEQELEAAYQKIKSAFDPSSTEWTMDPYGRRWIKCKVCGEIKRDSQMSFYGGTDGVNLGICSTCTQQNRKQTP